MKTSYRLKCTTDQSSARSIVNVNIAINRSGITQRIAVLPGGFKYAVSYILTYIAS